jgi:hypothetical protein
MGVSLGTTSRPASDGVARTWTVPLHVKKPSSGKPDASFGIEIGGLEPAEVVAREDRVEAAGVELFRWNENKQVIKKLGTPQTLNAHNWAFHCTRIAHKEGATSWAAMRPEPPLSTSQMPVSGQLRGAEPPPGNPTDDCGRGRTGR